MYSTRIKCTMGFKNLTKKGKIGYTLFLSLTSTMCVHFHSHQIWFTIMRINFRTHNNNIVQNFIRYDTINLVYLLCCVRCGVWNGKRSVVG